MKLISNRFYGVEFNKTLTYISDGNNLKMPELIALAAICDLDRSKERIKKRIKIAKRYQYLLRIPIIKLYHRQKILHLHIISKSYCLRLVEKKFSKN
jgi:dTDP-4-amino-4,6-dideoxygalactose transaminase